MDGRIVTPSSTLGLSNSEMLIADHCAPVSHVIDAIAAVIATYFANTPGVSGREFPWPGRLLVGLVTALEGLVTVPKCVS